MSETYTPHTWENAELITPSKLNNIQTGIDELKIDVLSPMNGATSNTPGSSGLVPKPNSGDDTKFLRGDATWVVPIDTHIGITSNTNTAYLIGSTTTPSNTEQAVNGVANTSVYMSNGTLYATHFNGIGTNLTQLNASNITSGIIQADSIPLATSTTIGGIKVSEDFYTDENSKLKINSTLALPSVSSEDEGKVLMVNAEGALASNND